MDSLEGYDSEEDADYLPGQEVERQRAQRRTQKIKEESKRRQVGAAVVESDEELEEALAVGVDGAGITKKNKKQHANYGDEEEDDEGDEDEEEEQETIAEHSLDPLLLASKRKREREAEDLFASLNAEEEGESGGSQTGGHKTSEKTSGVGMKLHQLARPAQKRKKQKVVQPWEKWLQPARPLLEDLESLIEGEAEAADAGHGKEEKKEAEQQGAEAESLQDTGNGSQALGSKLMGSEQASKKLTLVKDSSVEETDDALVVTELKEYAGKTVSLRRKIVKGSHLEEEFRKERVKQQKQEGNLGNLLAHLTKSKTITTLEKSRIDWQEDKVVEGDEHDLEQHSKSANSYISKQEFLQEADYAAFERERAVREQQRSQREAAAARQKKPS
eukprot:gb/GEZN01007187.1/.p1 GENE.gb/GEZN01007187.1/~~gb/GEZN01007187.1/.p1  ORF type:complete len:388 (-),score=135.17 gb/GEZN01007187.1/:364-1527(-)